MAFRAAPRPSVYADASFRRSVLGIRWLLLGLWVGLVSVGILEVSRTALLVSAGIIAAYDVFHVGLEVHATRTGGIPERIATAARYVDVVTITVALVALHDVRNPVWVIYFLGIVGVAHFVDRRQMFMHVAWATVNWYAFATITAANGYDVSWGYVAVVSIGLVLMGLNASVLAGGEQRLREVMAHAASTDSLTGLPNRHSFHANYATFLDEAMQQRLPLAVMLLDVDHFKEINDRDGHPAGDDKLRDVGAALQAVVRRGDMVARYGGDEFIVLAPRTSRSEALGLAQRLRSAAVEAGASVSIGVAVFPDDAESADALIEAADAALYQAKQAGRNCVRTAA